MNLNNQNPLIEHHIVLQQRGGGLSGNGGLGGGDVIRLVKPSQTVNQSNVNSTLSSVRQFQIISSKNQ